MTTQKFNVAFFWLRIALLVSALIALLLTGCTHRSTLVAGTGTVIGVEIAQNPSTQLYSAKLGYNRAEIAVIPTGKDDASKDASVTADLIMELRYGSIFSLSDATIYQRLAVGKVAVTQPGAALMFAKGPDGKYDNNAASALRNVQAVPAPADEVTSALLPLSADWAKSARKTDYDTIAKVYGYTKFDDFLADPKVTLETVNAVAAEIKKQGLP